MDGRCVTRTPLATGMIGRNAGDGHVFPAADGLKRLLDLRAFLPHEFAVGVVVGTVESDDLERSPCAVGSLGVLFRFKRASVRTSEGIIR